MKIGILGDILSRINVRKLKFILALQGAFQEHINALNKLRVEHVVAVKNADQLSDLDGLIIPGGESTTIAIVAERTGIWDALCNYVHRGRPVWVIYWQ